MLTAALALDGTVITDPAELRALAPEWRELLADSDNDEPTMSPEWLLTWWGVYGHLDARRLRVLVLRRRGELVGLAPMVLRRHWYRPGLPFRRLEPLASGERAGDGIISDYLGVLARRGHEEVVARSVISELSAGSLGRWDELTIPLMDGEKVMPVLLAEEARRAGLIGDVEETTRAPYIALPKTWDEYLAALPKKGRYLIKRSLRDFEAWADGDWSVLEASAGTLPAMKQTLADLHTERWDDQGGGVFGSARFSTFHDRIMPQLLERDALELLCLQVRGEPVAAMYNVRWANKTYFYQCGRSREVPPHIRPGGVLLYLAIRRSVEAGLREFDFLGGEAVYKKQLAPASRPLVLLRVARPGIRERARRSVRLARAVFV